MRIDLLGSLQGPRHGLGLLGSLQGPWHGARLFGGAFRDHGMGPSLLGNLQGPRHGARLFGGSFLSHMSLALCLYVYHEGFLLAFAVFGAWWCRANS